MTRGMVIDTEEVRHLARPRHQELMERTLRSLAARASGGWRASRLPFCTPCEASNSTRAGEYLKPDTTFGQLDTRTMKMGDNDAASATDNAREKLFQAIKLI